MHALLGEREGVRVPELLPLKLLVGDIVLEYVADGVNVLALEEDTVAVKDPVLLPVNVPVVVCVDESALVGDVL